MKTARADRKKIREQILAIKSSQEEKDLIENAAAKMGITMSALARIALKDYIKQHGLE